MNEIHKDKAENAKVKNTKMCKKTEKNLEHNPQTQNKKGKRYMIEQFFQS